MKKFIIVLSILFLIIVTTITKNSTKNIENEIFITKENINVLKKKYEYVLLDFNFLTAPQKLIEYQSKYFENDLIFTDINEIKKVIIKKNNLNISNFNQKKIIDEK